MSTQKKAIRTHEINRRFNFGLSILIWTVSVDGIHPIRLSHLEAPATVIAGQPIRLKCSIETKGDRLRSLSWYKNGREFFRYQPSERNNQVLVFNQIGVNVDISKSRNNTLVITNTTSDTSGRYKCQATGHSFQEVNMETIVKVLAANSCSCRFSTILWVFPGIMVIITLILMFD